MKDANDCPLRSCRVDHWAKDIETGSHAEFFSDGCYKAHGRVVGRRKHECNVALIHALRDLFGCKINLNA